MSVPFSGEEFTFTQPDGTALRVRGWGDQRHAVFEALNGYTVVADPKTGFYEYANVTAKQDELIPTGARPRKVDPRGLGISPGVRLSRTASLAKAMESRGLAPGRSRWEQRRRERRATLQVAAAADRIALAPPARKTLGKYVGLCLLVDFPDVPGTISDQQVDDFCNTDGYSGFGNNGSVRDYFLAVSNGLLDYRNIVAPYYTAAHPRDYYTDPSIPQPVRARELIKEALDYHRQRDFDFSPLTSDNQQYVYATNVFYAGTRVNNWSQGLWPHSFHLQTPYALTPNKNAFDYQISDMNDSLALGTFCHENGHMICDFPDLYDYGYESAGVGVFCLMGAGATASEKNPTQVGAYLKYKAGWAAGVVDITAGLTATVDAASNRFFARRNGSTEYYLIEGRVAEGRDAVLPASGLAIWHVDELGDNSNEQMMPSQHYECALVQADGRTDLEHDPQNSGDATDLFSGAVNARFGAGTDPSSLWWDGTPSGLEISEISAAAAHMTFKA